MSDIHRLDLRYDHALTEGRVRLALTGGYDRQGAAPTYMTNRSLGARLEASKSSLRRCGFAAAPTPTSTTTP